MTKACTPMTRVQEYSVVWYPNPHSCLSCSCGAFLWCFVFPLSLSTQKCLDHHHRISDISDRGWRTSGRRRACRCLSGKIACAFASFNFSTGTFRSAEVKWRRIKSRESFSSARFPFHFFFPKPKELIIFFILKISFFFTWFEPGLYTLHVTRHVTNVTSWKLFVTPLHTFSRLEINTSRHVTSQL